MQARFRAYRFEERTHAFVVLALFVVCRVGACPATRRSGWSNRPAGPDARNSKMPFSSNADAAVHSFSSSKTAHPTG